MGVRGSSISWLIPVGMLTLLGALLRISQIDQSLVGDELWTYVGATRPSFAEMLDWVQSDEGITPPLYTGLAWLSAKLGEVTVEDGAATADWTATWDLAAAPDWTYDASLRLEEGDDGWQVVAEPTLVHPELGEGQHLELARSLPERADITDAMSVGFWSAGSIARVTWASLTPSLVLGTVIVLAAIALSPALKRLELGDDAAVTQGTRPGPVRLALLVLGVATTALVTAAAGPIGFIALVAPQLARRITRSAGVSLRL